MRLLYQWHDHGVGGFSRKEQKAQRSRHQECAREQSLPLRHARAHRARGQTRFHSGIRELHMNIQISRRDALLGSGALVVSFSLPASIGSAQAQGAAKPLALTEVDSFLAIDKAGNVTVYSGKVDVGTGVTTALRQIVAEELDVPMGHIELIQGDTLLTPDQGNTWGS